MDGSLGSAAIKPDQVGIINPLLIIAITPLFNTVVYPVLKKCGIRTALQKIGIGGVLIGVAFVISGLVELELEVLRIKHFTFTLRHFLLNTKKTYPRIPETGLTQLNFVNTLPCHVNVSYNNEAKWIEANSFSFERDLKDEPLHIQVKSADSRCGNIELTSPEWSGLINGASSKVQTLIGEKLVSY